MTKHGTISRYTGGCRCAPCRAANAEYQHAYQVRRHVKAAGHNLAAGIRAGEASVTSNLHFHVGGQVVTTPITYVVGDRGAEYIKTRSPLELTLDELVHETHRLAHAFRLYDQAWKEPIT